MARYYEHIGIVLERLCHGTVGGGLPDSDGDIFVAATLPKWYLHSGFIDLLAKRGLGRRERRQRRGMFGEVCFEPPFCLFGNVIWSASTLLMH